MKRREFFSRIFSGITNEPQEAPKPLTERELFMRAMEMGIDPATVTPGQLRELVSDAKPQSTRASKRQSQGDIENSPEADLRRST